MEVLFFPTPADFRKWLAENHEILQEQWVGYYKKASGVPSITWPESVDEALCFGWIDGLRKTIDDKRYKIRFTPRKPRSNWSAVNIKRIEELKQLGLVQPAGLAAYEKFKDGKSAQYSYEQKNPELNPAYLEKIKEHPNAWQYFEALAPSYKRASVWFVMSAKREETRLRRLNILIESSAKGEKIPMLINSRKK